MSYEEKSLNEECGIFGVWNHPDASHLVYFGLHSLQHRGQEGCGIVTNDKGNQTGVRGLGLLSEVFHDQQIIENLKGESGIGHVRYATAGNGGVENLQPFMFRFHDAQYSVAHNGNLTNAVSMRRALEEAGAVFHSNSDTEILMHLIRHSHKKDFLEALKEALQQVRGGFAYVILAEDGLYAALDPNGFRPLSVGQMPNGSYVVASETCALDAVGASFVTSVGPGQIVIINDEGVHFDQFTDDTQLSICSMEFIYFARPDSDICGVNVHKARKKMGRRLAQEQPADADIVVGVPNSSLSAASGYAEECGLPYEMGLIKNQYVARTFIQPTQALREQGVKMKLSAVRGVVEGKRVILVDDSIVRGTTSQRIVRLLKDSGAKEVHLRIASPPLKYPCFYGIDIQTRAELIAAHYTVEEMRVKIGADSLAFLSEEGVIESINLPSDAPYQGLCMSYFNGDYQTPLYDYEEEYLKSLEETIQKDK